MSIKEVFLLHKTSANTLRSIETVPPRVCQTKRCMYWHHIDIGRASIPEPVSNLEIDKVTRNMLKDRLINTSLDIWKFEKTLGKKHTSWNYNLILS